jgi:hypothetical protein
MKMKENLLLGVALALLCLLFCFACSNNRAPKEIFIDEKATTATP